MKMIQVDFCKCIVLEKYTLNIFSFKENYPNLLLYIN